MKKPQHDVQKTLDDLLLSTVTLKAEVTGLVRLVQELATTLGVRELGGFDVVTYFVSKKIECLEESLEKFQDKEPEFADRIREVLGRKR